MKISLRLALSFGVMVIISFIISFYSITGLVKVKSEIEDLYRHPFIVSNAVREIDKNIVSIHGYMKDIILAKTSDERAKLIIKIEETEKKVLEQFNIIYDRYLGDKEDIDMPFQAFKEWRYIREEVILLISQGKKDEATEITKGKGFEHINNLYQEIKVLLDFANNKAEEFHSNAIIDVEKKTSKMVLLAIISFLMGIFLSVLTIRSIINPLKKVVAGIQGLAHGKLNTSIGVHSKSEMGLLANSFRQMQKNLSHKADIADAIALGNFKKTVEVNDLSDRLAVSINEIVKTFKDIVYQATRIAQGDFNFKVSKKSDDDELGVSLELMTKNLQQVIEQTKRIAQGDYTGRLVPNGENDEMSMAINQMTKKLFEVTNEASIQDKIKTSQNELNTIMQGDKEIPDLANSIISYICKTCKAEIGAIYLDTEFKQEYQLLGSYAFTYRKGISNLYRKGEGLVGQAALEKEIISITSVPDDYIRINSALGETSPKNIVLVPLVHENITIGIVELGSVGEFSDLAMLFLKTIKDAVAINIVSNLNRQNIKKHLQKTQELAEELQVQQEELRQSNDGLEQQTHALKKSEEALQIQQEELKVINEELEEKTQDLEYQKRQILTQNQELEKMKKELEQKAFDIEKSSSYKSEFLANMSHELRTPLNSLLILSQSLAENKSKNLKKDQIESINIIYDSGKYLLNLINEILDLSKIEAGKMDIEITDVSIPEILNEMEQSFNKTAENKGIKLIIASEQKVPEKIKSDQVKMAQILRNLLSNAIKFTSSGEVSLNVRFANENDVKIKPEISPPDYIVFSVRDTGIGIPQEQFVGIFDAFKQVDGSISRKYGGTGLGLSITMRLLRLLNGDIHLESQEGKGSVFTVFFPLDIEQKRANKIIPEQQKDKQPGTASLSTSNNLNKKNTAKKQVSDDRDNIKSKDDVILVVEDDFNFAGVLHNICNKRGFKCIVATSGEEAFDILKEYTIKAIILDLGLPGMSGEEFMEVLKNNAGARHIPIHIVSGKDENLNLYTKGAIGFLQKPLEKQDIDEMFNNLSEYLNKKIKKLLIVEDNEIFSSRINNLLQGKDLEISVIQTGEAAVTEISENQYDCIILDLVLPDISGFQVLEKLEKTEAKIPPVIIYTGKELTKKENDLLERFASTIIIKGIKSDERLIDEIALFLHRVVRNLPEKQKQLIHRLYNKEEMFKGKTILIVDDDIRNVFALSKIFEENNITVKRAENGKIALDIMEKEGDSIDLILMDVMMPVMDGFQTITEIRKQTKFSGLPIIAVTAKAMKSDKEKCIKAGANDYLSKPIDIEKLFTLMRVWLYR